MGVELQHLLAQSRKGELLGTYLSSSRIRLTTLVTKRIAASAGNGAHDTPSLTMGFIEYILDVPPSSKTHEGSAAATALGDLNVGSGRAPYRSSTRSGTPHHHHRACALE